MNNLLLQLHAVQLQLHTTAGTHVDSESIKNKLVSYIYSLSVNKSKGAFMY